MTAQLPIQKERLEEIARGEGRLCVASWAEQTVMARALLAAHEQEPVMYASAETLFAAKDGEQLLRTLSEPSGDCIIPLFTNPEPSIPAVPEGWKLVPIDPTKNMLRAGQSVVGFWLNTVHCYAAMLSAAPVFRAAMLQAEPVKHPSSNQASADADIAGEIKQPASNSGWIPVSERMPDFFYSVLVSDEYEDMAIATPVDFSTGERCAFRMSNGDIFLATHWQPLPDAPKVTP